MAITHDIELKSGIYPQAYHAIVEIRVTDRWSNLQRNQAPDQRPAKYSIQIFTDIWADEAARISGVPPISRRVDRGSVDAGKDVWAEGYRILDDALQGKHATSERTKRIKAHVETVHTFVVAPEEFRFLKLRGAEKKVTPSDAGMLLKILPQAESDGQAEGKFFFDEAPMTLTLDEINDLFRQLAGQPAPASPAPVEEHKFPAPDERLSDWDFVGVSDTERGVLKTAMEEGESVSAAKRRLYPILNEELSRLQNQEALLGASTPESVSARRKEVESLLGILARVGDA